MIFERQGKMVSDAGQAAERVEFDDQVNAICSSVQ